LTVRSFPKRKQQSRVISFLTKKHMQPLQGSQMHRVENIEKVFQIPSAPLAGVA
jgi:hypothetical protein